MTPKISGVKGRLILVCGLPGSGKTTRSKALEGKLGAVRFCPDEWLTALEQNLYDEAARARVEALQWELAKRLLQLGATVIIEWGVWGKSERDALRLGARAAGATVELHYLSAPMDVLFERIQRRGQEDPPFDWESLLRASELFQIPQPDELALFDQWYR